MASWSDSDPDSVKSDSDEEEEEVRSGDLSDLGAAATTIKFETVKKQTFQAAKTGPEKLAQQILESCGSSNHDIGLATEEQEIPSRELTVGSGSKVLQQNFIQVQQQFGDVTVQGTRNLTIGGTQNIGSMGPSQEQTSLIEKLNKRSMSKIESMTKGMVKTSALSEVMEKLNRGSDWITIKGSPGEGKSVAAYMALGELQKTGRQVFHLMSPKEFSEVTMSCIRPVILLDDIFGSLEFDHSKWLKWEETLHDVLDVAEHSSHKRQTKEDVTVILVGRDYVLNSASCHMGKMADFFSQEQYVVDMSHTVERQHKEKLSIWRAISESCGIELEQRIEDTICSIRCPHGFPHVCRLFLTLQKKHPEITAEEFFKTPLEFLNQTVLKFMQNKQKLTLFKEMIKGDGRTSVQNLGKLDNSSDIIQTAYELVGTYLRMENDDFIFDHPSIYDSVACNVSKLYPLFVIEHCNLSFVHGRLLLQPSNESQPHTLSKESGLNVYIPRSYAGDLANRFATEIENFNLWQILSHRLFRDERFIKNVIGQITLSMTEVVKLTDRHSGECFLSLVASSKSCELLKYIEYHTDIEINQRDVLYGVCKYASSDALTYLRETRDTLDLNVKFGEKSQTPLMVAAETRDSQFVHQIMSLNPDLNSHDRCGKTALHYLCEHGLVSAVKQAMDRKADIDVKDQSGGSPLYYACWYNHVKIVKLLLDKGAKIDGEAVREACLVGNMEMVEMLFERGATVNMISDEYTPLHTTAIVGHIAVIRYLIDKGASVNHQGHRPRWSPLHVASYHNNRLAVQCLLDHGADIDCKNIVGETPLHKAAESASSECVDVLLKAGADVNAQSTRGYTPLHKAAGSGARESVVMLLKADADVNAQIEDGDTALHMSAWIGSHDCIAALVEAGADVNAMNGGGQHALHKAISNYNHHLPDLSVCQTLIRYGSNINSQDVEGNTALHQLCRVDRDTEIYEVNTCEPASAYKDVYRTLVTLLLDHGAGVKILNNKGESALRGWAQTLVRQDKHISKSDKQNLRSLHESSF